MYKKYTDYSEVHYNHYTPSDNNSHYEETLEGDTKCTSWIIHGLMMNLDILHNLNDNSVWQGIKSRYWHSSSIVQD